MKYSDTLEETYESSNQDLLGETETSEDLKLLIDTEDFGTKCVD